MLRLLILSCCCLSLMAAERLLFFGSSSTFYHDMPASVADLLTELDQPTEHHWVGEGGTWTYVYLQDGYRPKSGLPRDFQGNVLDYMIQEQFPAISLQVACGKWDEWQQALPRYAEAAKQAGSKLYLYEQAWDRSDEDALHGSPLLQMAADLDLSIIPCRSAWMQVYADHPDWDLQDSHFHVKSGEIRRDGTHPGLLGNYLNQACFIAALTGTSPEGRMPTRYRHDARMAHPQSQLPAGISLDEHDGKIAWFTVDQDLATYLQGIAWQTWQAVDQKRKALRSH